MKKDIHPQYAQDTTMTCSCGSVFKTGSTSEKLEIETCSQCHPFFTGKQKIVDSTGRVDRFKKLAEKADSTKKTRASVKSKDEKKALREEKKAEKTASEA